MWCDMILRTTLQWLEQSKNQSLNSDIFCEEFGSYQTLYLPIWRNWEIIFIQLSKTDLNSGHLGVTVNVHNPIAIPRFVPVPNWWQASEQVFQSRCNIGGETVCLTSHRHMTQTYKVPVQNKECIHVIRPLSYCSLHKIESLHQYSILVSSVKW